MSEANPHEIEYIIQLKKRLDDLDLRDVEDVDQLYLKFLRARDLNLNKAEDMLRKHIQWRKENKIESLLDWEPPSMLPEVCPYEISGFDNTGCPVLLVPFGTWDVRRICESGTKPDYIRYVDQLFINVIKAMGQSSKVNGRKISQFVMIMVPDGLAAFRQMSSAQAVDVVLETVTRFEANYPETLKAAFIVDSMADSPKVFQMIFSVIRPLLNSKTLGKVTLASSPNEWKRALLSLMSPDQLPPRLGGTAQSHIPLLNTTGKSLINPENGNNQSTNGLASFVALTIAPGRRFSVEYEIQVPSTQFSWAFKTDKCDIGFSLLFDGTEIVVPYSRLNSHENVQCGSIMCQKSGKYVLVFDNSFSRWRSKIVRYRVSMDELADHDEFGDTGRHGPGEGMSCKG